MSAFMTIDAATLHSMFKQDDLVLIDVRNDAVSYTHLTLPTICSV